MREASLRIESRQHAKNLISLISKRNGSVRLVCDMSSWPATHGDFMSVVLLARVLVRSDLNVKISLVNFQTARRFEGHSESERAAHIRQWRDLAILFSSVQNEEGRFVPAPNFEFEVVSDLRQLDQGGVFQIVIRPSKALLYVSASRILIYLWRLRGGVIDESFFLLDEFKLTEADKARFGLPRDYITWHIRKTIGNHQRDQSPGELKSIFQVLRKAPLPVVVVTTTPGWLALNQALRTEKGLDDDKIIFLGEVGYLDSLRTVLTSLFHCQLFGGGVSAAAHYSRVPVLEVQFSPGSMPRPRGAKFFPWQSLHQRFLLADSREQGLGIFIDSCREQMAQHDGA